MAYTTVNKPRDYFNNMMYNGNNVNDNQIDGVGFKPATLWIKDMDRGSNHVFTTTGIQPAIVETQGAGAQQTGPLSSTNTLHSDGFTVTGNNNDTNYNTDRFMSFSWRGAGSSSANNDGSITSNVDVNTTSKCSTIQWTGSGANGTIGHGLGVTPRFARMKCASNSSRDWVVYHAHLGNAKGLRLNLDSGENSAGTYFNDTSPTSSVFNLGSNANTNSGSMIMLCQADVPGYFRAGKYEGTGNNNGMFCYTGFKPAFILLKMNSTGGWFMWSQDPSNADSPDGVASGGYDDSSTVDQQNYANVIKNRLLANTQAGTDNSNDNRIDFLSNGFKVRDNATSWNQGNVPSFWAAWAQFPLVGTNNAISLAR